MSRAAGPPAAARDTVGAAAPEGAICAYPSTVQTPRADRRLAARFDRLWLARPASHTGGPLRSPRAHRGRRGAPGTLLASLLVIAALLGACTSNGAETDPPGGARAGATVRPSPSAEADARVRAGAARVPATAGATPAPAVRAEGEPFCGASKDVEDIVVQRWTDTRFRISLRPTAASRKASRVPTVAAMWTAINTCVRGLAGPVADSLHAQLTCHQALAQLPALGGGSGFATGATYDLESWRPLMRPNSFSTWVSTRCANTLGSDPPGPAVRIYRPDGVPVRHTITGEHA